MMTYTITRTDDEMVVTIKTDDGVVFDAMCRIEEAVCSALEDVKSEVDR